MADANAVLTAFRAELIAAGLVRRPSAAMADGPALIGNTPWRRPPMVIEPLEGPPGPGELEGVQDDPGLVVSLLQGGEVTPSDNADAAAGRTVTLDVRYRSKTTDELRRVVALDAAINDRLIRPETNYGYGFILAETTGADLWVQSVGIFAGLGPIARSRAAGYDHVAKYAVTVHR